MWGLSTLGLLLSLAAAVLLGLTTFGVPVNHSIWLLKVTLVDLDLKCGTLGYTLGDQDSRTRVGYDMPRKVGNEDISSITSVIHKLTYVLVCFPIGACAIYNLHSVWSRDRYSAISVRRPLSSHIA